MFGCIRKHKSERAEAQRMHAQLAAQEPEVEKLSHRAKIRVEHNHIAEAIAASFRGRNDHHAPGY